MAGGRADKVVRDGETGLNRVKPGLAGGTGRFSWVLWEFSLVEPPSTTPRLNPGQARIMRFNPGFDRRVRLTGFNWGSTRLLVSQA